jgi:hexosaminidase
VSITDTNEDPPQQGTNESYALTIDAFGNASLNAVTVYGAMRGMETFSQLVRYQFSTATYFIANVPLVIEDEPRFVHRGFMVDTSRHFQTLGMLKRLIDSMSYAKMNVLHWHAVDDQSFPLQVDAFPQLQEQVSLCSQSVLSVCALILCSQSALKVGRC